MPQKANPYLHDIGYVTCRDNHLSGNYCVLYDGKEIDADGYRWLLTCSRHATHHGVDNKRLAIQLLREPAKWCPQCHTLADIEQAEYLLMKRTTRSNGEQLRRLAKLAKGDPEKCLLFERLTGKLPDHYLA